MLLTVVAFIVTVGVIITVHELGHFLAARLTGMRVKRFSIGFPPKMISRRIGDTEFSLSWIPLGGFVQIAGMIDESLEEGGITGAPDEFMSKNALQKCFTLSAGVLMNYLSAFVIIAVLAAVVGVGVVNGTVIGEVLSGMPAMSAGVRAGDRIAAVDGHPTAAWDDVVRQISSGRDSVTLTLRRGENEEIVLRLGTQRAEAPGGKRRMIGIAPNVKIRPATPLDVVRRGWNFCAGTTAGIVSFIVGLARGESSLSELAGPLGVARLSGESAREGSGAFLFFIAYVSVSIGFLNILPFPALDGGHIVYVLVETVMRRPIPTMVKLRIQQVGLTLLILLVLFVSYHDVVRIFTE
jgi:regulator of sigma E protease